MESMKRLKIWIMGWLILVIGVLSAVAYEVVKVDPFFHYHKPNMDLYYYDLNNQRYQNDGISKQFDYDALITGTSMTENFKTSEMDELFETNSIKVPYSGGSYKEINDNLINALENNPELKIIVRGLDMSKFIHDKDAMVWSLDEYPTYLYDNVWYNDVKYIFNRDVIFERVYPMVIANDSDGFKTGITSFDSYSNWMQDSIFGIDTVAPDGIEVPEAAEPIHLSDSERDIVLGTVHQNVTSLPESYPDVTFYYFFTPYPITWWRDLVDEGTIYKWIEAEQLYIEEILKYDNIELYSFNNLTNITTDLNNYKDAHYGSWVNSLILRYMKEGKCLLTYDNYEDYLDSELSFYTTFDYSQINGQIDYENDYYAEALLNYEINGVEPLNLLDTYKDTMELKGANIIEEQYNGEIGLRCRGSLLRESESNISVAEYIATNDYIGAKIGVDDIKDYKYLVFYGMKGQDQGEPSVYIYDENDAVLAGFTESYYDLDNQWHQYIIDITNLSGPATIVFNGGYIDRTGSKDSLYTFSNMILY